MSKRKSESTIAPVEFIDRVIKLDEKGEPFSLAPYHRRVLELALRGRGLLHEPDTHATGQRSHTWPQGVFGPSG